MLLGSSARKLCYFHYLDSNGVQMEDGRRHVILL